MMNIFNCYIVNSTGVFKNGSCTIFSQHGCSDKFSPKHLPVKGLINIEIIITMKKAHKQIKNNTNAKMHYNELVYGPNLQNSRAVFKTDNTGHLTGCGKK